MKTDIVIVGAGIAGAATAYHLRRLGQGGVLILEKEDLPGKHSTGLNAAILRQHLWNLDRRALALESGAVIRSGELAEFRQVGGMIIEPDAYMDVSIRFPLAVGRGTWRDDDGVADPAGLLQSYLRGQNIRCNTYVEDWKPLDEGVLLRTNNGEIEARVMVNATGPWAGTVGRLPLTSKNRHLYLTGPMDEIDPDWPYVWDDINKLYFRPDSGGLLLCPCDEEPREPGNYRTNESVMEVMAQKLEASQPALANVTIKQSWTGQRTFAPDGQFVIGFDIRHHGLFHVAGLGGHGVTTSYAVGRLAAEILVGLKPPHGSPFDPARLANEAGPLA